MAERNSSEYQKMRREVLSRDGHKCQFPGCSKKTKLEVHHVCPFSIGYGQTDASNCITLCHYHHKSIKNKELFYVQLFNDIIKRNNKK